MKLEKLLRDISLRGIAFLVILIGLWSVVLMVGVSFGWSFLTDKVADAFYLGGFIAGLLIFALAVSSITANLTIISKTQNSEDQQSQGILKQLGLLIGLSILLVAFLVGGLWFAEWNVYNQRKEDAKLKIETLLEKSQLTLLSEEIKNNGKVEKIIEIRDALSYDISSEGRISFLFPKDRAGMKIYYELTPWFSNHSGSS